MNSKIEENYQVTIVEGSSPLTRRPSTPYIMAGVGILKETSCESQQVTKPQPPISRPSTEAVSDKPEQLPCTLTAEVVKIDVHYGGEFSIRLQGVNESELVSWVVYYDEGVFEEIGEDRYKVIGESGAYVITHIAQYRDGRECKLEVTVNVAEKPVSPDPPHQATLKICPGEKREIGRVKVTVENKDRVNPLIIGMGFDTISGASFPDLILQAPNGETYGYMQEYLNSTSESSITSSKSASMVEYSGYAPQGGDEEFRIHDPIEGDWIFSATNTGGSDSSVLTFYVNEGLEIEVTYDEPNC